MRNTREIQLPGNPWKSRILARIFRHSMPGFGCAISTLLLSLSAVPGTADASPEKPNILWISCEDTSPDLGCYGDRYATTPNLDKFAAEGCRFDRAYVTFPVCAPSRSSIITGVHPGTLGTHQMRTGMKNYEAVPPPEVKCFTEYLRAADYYCSNHTKTDYQFDAPFTAWDAGKGDWRNPDRQSGQPFFCVINLGCSHESQCWDITKLTHDPGKAPLPAFYIHNFTPQVPYEQTIPYMEKSPILQEWRRLNAAGELAGPRQLWFAPRKPDEELYDTAADPDEVNNLAGKPEHAATLKRMRAALDTWMTDIHDLGGVPEEQLIERFWPGHQQPVTATPVIETAADGTVTITCATPGASIGYRLGNSQKWHVFAGPFKASEAVHAKAIRLGYKVSEEN
jgi:hypothetical protein